MPTLRPSLARAALRGFSIVPLLTPFTADGALDEATTRRLVEFVIAGGCQGVLVAGTTGEAASMPIRMRLRLVELAIEQARGRALIFGGIGDNSQHHSLELAHGYAQAGIDAVVAHAPSYYPIPPAELEAYFLRLADRVAAPLYLYNIPQTTRLSLPFELVERLSHHERIAGIKDSEPDGARQQQIAKRFAGRPDFAVFCGSIPYTSHAMRAGADGYVPSAGNVAPRLTRQLMDCWVAGDEVQAEKLLERVLAVSAIYQRGRNVSQSLCAMKGVLEVRGFGSRHMLPPLAECTDAEVAEMQRLLEGEPVVA